MFGFVGIVDRDEDDLFPALLFFLDDREKKPNPSPLSGRSVDFEGMLLAFDFRDDCRESVTGSPAEAVPELLERKDGVAEDAV
jgi:hypothetical protein